MDRIKSQTTATINENLFAGYDPSNGETLRYVLDRLCESMCIDSSTVEYTICNETQWISPTESSLGTYEFYDGVNYITVHHELLNDPHTLISMLVHELGHALLIGEGRIIGDEYDHEPLTDLLAVFMGYGPIIANSAVVERNQSFFRATADESAQRGYMTMPMYGYAIAVLSLLRGESSTEWRARLRPDVRDAFVRTLRAFNNSPPPDYNVLQHTDAKPRIHEIRRDDETSAETEIEVDFSRCVYCGDSVEAEMEPPVCGLCQKSIDENQSDLAAEQAIANDPHDIRRARMWYALIGIFFLIVIVVGYFTKKN